MLPRPNRIGTYNGGMKLALIGADNEALELLRWAVSGGGHALVSAFDVAGRATDVQAIAPHVRLNEHWESLVLGSAVDAVIVARAGAGLTAATGIPDDERRAEQLRKLAQAAVPMLVICPACEAIVGFEIEMIRRDVCGIIIPYIPGENHPGIAALENLASWGQTSPLGAVEQITFECEQADRSRPSVLLRFARNVTLLRHLIGTVRSLTASGPSPTVGRDPLGPKPKELASLANLNVHVAGDEGLAARWSMAPPVDRDQGRLTVVGQRGRLVLHMPAHEAWRLEATGNVTPPALTGHDEFTRLFWQLDHALSSPEEFYDKASWLGACRDQEVAEAVDRSLARGRTIELFGEEHTEEDSFKGVMAVGGCLLLSMALLVVFVATVVEGLRLPLRDWMIWKYWPIYLLVPVVVFLLLQLLQFAVKREDVSLRRLVEGDGPRN
jgi:hypothetical protein